jgi:hypothetical protein
MAATTAQPKLNDCGNGVFSPNNMTVNLNQMMLTGGSELNAPPSTLSHMDLSQQIQYPFKAQNQPHNAYLNNYENDRRIRYLEDSVNQRDREIRDLQEHLRIVEL